jgi:putative holliday junction resolvase
MRIMALDVGDKMIGIAISDALLLTAQGRPTLKRRGLASDLEHLRKLVQEEEVHEIVVGQPFHMDGSVSLQSQKIAKFARKLHVATNVPIVFWDERLTSVAAEEHLEEMGLNWRKRREHVDRVAAMFILQSYLDRQRV